MSLVDAKRHCESKFDYDPFDAHSTGGDIVYKILGIEPDTAISRAPSIILSKKVRRDQDTIEEEPIAFQGSSGELESLKHLFEQEELRDDYLHTPDARSKIKKIKSSSKILLNKKLSALRLMHSSSTEQDDASLHESQSDISLYKPVVSFRESAAELGSNIIKKVKHSKIKSGRSSNDGVGMATLLVRSMMTAPSLDSIAENVDLEKNSPNTLKPLGKLDRVESGSMISLPTKKNQLHHHPPPHVENKLNLCVGDSIIDLKSACDGNLSSGVSLSSVTISETSSEGDEDDDDDDDDCSELGDEVVMIDADTISMYVCSLFLILCILYIKNHCFSIPG